MKVLELTTILISLAAFFSLVNIRLLKLPTTIGLMVLALLLAVCIMGIGLVIPSVYETVQTITVEYDFSNLLVNVMLPFLLFAGAISVNVHELLKDKLTILLLASFGVLFSTFAIGTALHWMLTLPFLGLGSLGLSYIDCLLFGALIAPTDPIAVLAMVKKMNLSSITETRIAGESLFNDGIGVVVFLTLLNIQQNGVDTISASTIFGLFATEVGGGVLLGAVLGFLGLKLVKYIENEHVELEVLITIIVML